MWELGYVLGVLAGVTDFLDGWIARRYGMQTDFGALMDYVSDKIQVAAGFILLTEKQRVPGWVSFVILAREFAVSGLREAAAEKKIKIRSSRLGKLKTWLQMTALLIAGARLVRWIPESVLVETLWEVWLVCTVVATVASGAQYFTQNVAVFMKDL